MKQRVARILSKAVLASAKNSAKSVCDWISYQPKVPARLTEEKSK